MFPAFGIIVAHIEFEHFTDSLGMLDRAPLQLDVVADKLPEFLRGDFTKTFEPCYFRSFSELFRRFVAFLLRVAVMCLFLVPDTEKRRFKNVEVPRKNQRLEKGQEKCDQQIPDVKTVHVGVGCDNDLRITQIVDILSMHDIEKLFVRVNRVQFQTVTVQRLAAEREYSLVHRIAALFQ